ncbi:MAG: 16S rRNA (uracil(1498)-N(3))-methyltransferase [Oscillospiraceae bacterium]|nr:16S rRNA (uracil(1498)-N(3))-methyltransferase [Oscillospiraceae bacterium]
MTSPRLIIGDLPKAGRILLDPEEARHLSTLRMRVGDSVVLCDGRGSEALCCLTAPGEADILELRPSEREDYIVPVHLYPSVSKGERFEWTLQKATELGVASVTPVISERCVAGVPSADRMERFKKIIRSAAEQSGRSWLPELLAPIPFAEAAQAAEGVKLFCYEEETEGSLKGALRAPIRSPVSVLTGPEGGYTPEEARLAGENGFQSVSLGRGILRCETAPLMVLSVIRFIEM